MGVGNKLFLFLESNNSLSLIVHLFLFQVDATASSIPELERQIEKLSKVLCSNLPGAGAWGWERIYHLVSWAPDDNQFYREAENHCPTPIYWTESLFRNVFFIPLPFHCLPSVSSSFEKSCFIHPRCFEQSPWVRTATDAATGCCPIWLVSLWKEQRRA